MGSDLMLTTDVPAPTIPKEWRYEQANKDFDKAIHSWRRLSIDVVSQMWVFYRKLKVGHNPPKSRSENSELPTWLEWLKLKGISDKTPINHFKALGWLPGEAHVSRNTGESEWYTPPEYIEAARTIMGKIDIDPATTENANKQIKAKRFYTADDDGLTKTWKGTVWMNPPYVQPLVTEFCDTFAEKFETGEITEGCILINNCTETAFAQRLLGTCLAVCFPAGRVRFLDKAGKPGAPLQGQMVLYFGNKPEVFQKEFSRFGVCILCAAK